MKGISVACAALVLSMPSFVVALELELGNGFPFSGIDSFVSGIISNTNVESSSGGIVAPGGAAESGNGSASADVRTILHSGSGGMIYKTEIRTESDGVVHTEMIEKTIAPKKRSGIFIATSSKDVNVQVQMVIEGRSKENTSGLPSLFGRFIAPKQSTQVRWGNESAKSESDVSGTQANVFSSFWLRARAFFGFF